MIQGSINNFSPKVKVKTGRRWCLITHLRMWKCWPGWFLKHALVLVTESLPTQPLNLVFKPLKNSIGEGIIMSPVYGWGLEPIRIASKWERSIWNSGPLMIVSVGHWQQTVPPGSWLQWRWQVRSLRRLWWFFQGRHSHSLSVRPNQESSTLDLLHSAPSC